MDFSEVIYTEELRINSGEEGLNKLFRQTLNEIFSPIFLKKIDRVFDTSLNFSYFKKRTNVMCYTQGTKIYINRPMFESTPKEKAMNYIMHEMFHVLINTGKFQELKIVQNNLASIVSKAVKKENISEFLTGKKQDIHSYWQGETLSYLCNNSIKWDAAILGTKKAYYITLKQSGLFNLGSNFWKKRFSDIDK